ncbi:MULTISPECIES: LysR family transcriptional regulator [unclassified Sphingobium]|uniref:LysR family transcriptional regulator n=1 Tax=unclassified Sphingobium TaxID=2611147 RepID=UPI0022247EBE|nr:MULTISPECIES: LysR family transcriptional regulator [unclassified Sphingobium]MCW2394026.1 DNA-binding transcriptional LysR family regulator [Sphingobium sp. B8D3B]MCW2417540.1 DNA-binding transcriptional LysR family regulator [Sphingobium sp. B8D3C]
MRFEGLDLNLLVALDILIELKSVSRSARQLNLTQPAVSAALNRLRDYFGDELLVTSGRAMLLTPKAEELRDPVREALIFIHSKITTPASFDPKTAERRIVLCGSDYSFDVLLAEVLRRSAKIAPGLTYDFIPIDWRAGERLERGEIDLYLTISGYLLSGHPKETLWEDEQCVIAWNQGRYAESLTASDFAEAGHAVAYFGPDRQQSIAERNYQALHVERRVEVRLPNFSLLPAAVIGTDRVATIHRRHARHYARLLPIVIHDAPITLDRVVGEVQWHRLRTSDAAISYVRSMIVDCAAEILGTPQASHE